MRSVLRNFMCGVGWDKKKHFPISRSTLPRCYMLLCTMTLQITTYIGTYIHSNLVFHGNKYRALFTVCSLHNFRQISEVEIEFWTVLTYWHWFIKTGWIWRFVFFHFDDIWWSCCKQTPELPELGDWVAKDNWLAFLVNICLILMMFVWKRKNLSVSSLTNANIKIKMDRAKFLIKSSGSKWIMFKTYFETMDIGQEFTRYVH